MVELGWRESYKGLELISATDVAHCWDCQVSDIVKLTVYIDLEFAVTGLVGGVDYEDVEAYGEGEMFRLVDKQSSYRLERGCRTDISV